MFDLLRKKRFQGLASSTWTARAKGYEVTPRSAATANWRLPYIAHNINYLRRLIGPKAAALLHLIAATPTRNRRMSLLTTSLSVPSRPLLLAGTALAAGYDAELDPVPFDEINRADCDVRHRRSHRHLEGNTLTVHGSFFHRTSPAIGGRPFPPASAWPRAWR